MFRRRAPTPRRRILIVNAYVDEQHGALKRATAVLKSLGPAYLAGAFNRRNCDLVLHDEHTGGPIDLRRLEGLDMLVLTGMTSAFDRMLQLSAYTKSMNRGVVVVAGGSAIRSLPFYSQDFFDYACLGDIEELQQVAEEALGPDFAAEQMVPQYDLAPWLGGSFSYAESSRNCNFHCSFCALTAEGNRYQLYDLAYLERQIRAGGRRDFLVFIDNNFYGNDRAHFAARLELLHRLRREGLFRAWGALVTNDFFLDEGNVERAAASGCEALFCGIESFDRASLERFKKFQNTRLPQVETIRRCLQAGVLFIYGLMFDVTSRDVADMEAELEFILATPEISMPAFFAFPIPYPRTPFFNEGLQAGSLLPLIRVTDLDGSKLSIRPLDAQGPVVSFMENLQQMRGYRTRLLRHEAEFMRIYRSRLSPRQLAVMFARSSALMAAKPRAGVEARVRDLRVLLTRTGRPEMKLESRFERYFRPTLLTDERGQAHPSVERDLTPLRRTDPVLRVLP